MSEPRVIDSSDQSSRRKQPRIAITLGDPNGIGPEVVLKCLADARLLKYMQPIVIGSAHVLNVHAHHLGMQDLRVHVVTHVPDEGPDNEIMVLDVVEGEKPEVHLGTITKEGGSLAMNAVECATDLCLAGTVDAMVTAPISKEAISKAGYKAPGHTEFIAQRTGVERFTMMMVSDMMRVGLVTGHVSIWDIPKRITKEAVLEKLDIISGSLQRDFAIQRPKIAVLGLNPHASDGGLMGREEADAILPAVEAMREEGHLVFGPFPADGFFGIGAYRLYDAVLAMYHDQGLIPFKTLTFESGVNFTAGLPIIRTSPDHGTAYNIAGEGKASPGSMRSAVYLAVDVARQRVRHEHQRKAG